VLLRQAAKAITFGILYGAGPEKIAWQVTTEARRDNPNADEFTVGEAKDAIKDYFKTFSRLSRWIAENQAFITENGFTYSNFGRKRRLPNVFSSDRGIKGHTVRSGINFLIQSMASDVNLLAAIDMMNWIKVNKSSARMFALVHDSILAEVPEAEVEAYSEALRGFVQMDRGVSIPGTPIGCDFEVAYDYSMVADKKEDVNKTKYEKYEEKWDAAQ
jgi:DNA polymerase I-like protein with 3'-5' exonuclease and polymerase domains